MASISNPRIGHWQESKSESGASVPVESLPFAAALIDRTGRIVAASPEWLSGGDRKGSPGDTCWEWGESLGNAATEVSKNIEDVLNGREQRFEHNYRFGGSDRRVTVSACPGGALITDQPCVSDSGPAEGRRQAQKMETMGRLAGGVAHDFANLLTLIGGYSEILLNRVGQKDPLRPELEEIRNAAARGSRLTGQLLGFTRGQTAEPRPLDLNLIISDVYAMLRPIIGEHIEFEKSLERGLGKVNADPGQIEQIIMNLILNARDAMPAGGRITVETSNCELGPATAVAHGVRPGPYVMFSVSDTGHGIGPDTIGQIFEPLFTTKEKGKGTGLGLSTAQNIVRQNGGDIWVDSASGEGATFTVCLPRVTESADVQDAGSALRPAAVGCETVLVVEDEDAVRRLLIHILEKRGFRVLEASDGVEALRLFDERGPRIDLVLTDMVMPKMGGRELADNLRERRPDLKIIYMSGYTDDVLVRTGALGPGMSLLQKPLRPDVVAAKIREALDSPTRPFNPR